jgi:DNA-binding MarR family transcriptional regulator
MNALRQIVRALRAGNSAMERTIGVSSAQLFALRQIERRPGLSLSDLAAATSTSQGAISEVASRLVDRKFVTRKISVDDRRRTQLEATTEGRAVLESAPETPQERLLASLLKLPSHKRQLLARGLEEWIKAAGLEGVEPTMFFEAKG